MIYNIGIIGGGMAGLSSAYTLLKNHPNLNVKIFEKNPYIGGLLGSINIRGHNIEVYYHHTFPDDYKLYALMNELGIKNDIEWETGSTAFLYRGKIYGFNTAKDMLSFPVINFWEKFRVGISVLLAKRIKDWREYDNITAKEYIIKIWGKSVYEKLWVPLLRAKFGPNMEKVSAAWFIRRIQLRSHRDTKGERLAYLHGGWQKLIDELIQKIKEKGGKIYTDEKVTKIEKEGNKYKIKTANREYNNIDYIISTIPQPIFNEISPIKIKDVSYQGCISVIITLKRKIQDYYWVNISDTDAEFSVMVEHTNFFKKNPYPYHLIYLAFYTDGEHIEKDRLKKYEEKIVTSFKRIFDVNEGEIIDKYSFYSPFAGPVYEIGYKEKLPPIRIENEKILIGGIPRSYPERSINDSITQGIECAKNILEEIK